MISIIIPLYNKKDSIKACLRSVADQTYKNYEVIIIDDGSTDGSLEELKSISFLEYRLISQENSGVSSARNLGIKNANGEYVAFLDADDMWFPDYLKVQSELISKYPQCSIFATNYKFRQKDMYISTKFNKFPFLEGDGILFNYFECAYCSHPPLWTSALVVKTEDIKKVGGFPNGVKSGEDLLTWARMSVNGSIAFSMKVCAIYNLGDGYDFSNLPPRRQDKGDPVGKGLKSIYKSNRNIQGLRKYISHWHKMRASVAIRYGEKIETLIESCKCLYYNPINYKILPFIFLSFMPALVRKRIFMKFRG